MGDEAAGRVDEPAKPSRSAPKKDSAKKLAALWKKQLKLLKAKDPDKKREGLAFCAQNPQFFREQPEVLPALLALSARLKVGQAAKSNHTRPKHHSSKSSSLTNSMLK